MDDSNTTAGLETSGVYARTAVFRSFRMSDQAVLCEEYRLCCSDEAASYLQGPTVAVDLNETAVEILRRCVAARPVQDIVDDVVALYVGAPADEIERSVRDFLDSALQKGWLRRLGAGG